MNRSAQKERITKETSIKVSIDIDGTGRATISTGIGFFDHMLTLFACHGLFDLEVKAEGDLQVDYHHTVEDVGIVLGDCILEALGNRVGIRRYGHAVVPMDEALAMATVDLGGRPYLVYNCEVGPSKVGDFDVELAEEFLRALSNHLLANIHVNLIYGKNSHHILEAIFKALARSLDTATAIDPRVGGQPTTKGVL